MYVGGLREESPFFWQGFPIDNDCLPKAAVQAFEIAEQHGNFDRSIVHPIFGVFCSYEESVGTKVTAHWLGDKEFSDYGNKGSRSFFLRFNGSFSKEDFEQADVPGVVLNDFFEQLKSVDQRTGWETNLIFRAGRLSRTPESEEKTEGDKVYPAHEIVCLSYCFDNVFKDLNLSVEGEGRQVGNPLEMTYADIRSNSSSPGDINTPFRDLRAWPSMVDPTNGKSFERLTDYDEIVRRHFSGGMIPSPGNEVPLEEELAGMSLDTMVQEVAPRIFSAMYDFVEN